MGKKVPAKKHRGIRDPVQQQEIRWNKIKGNTDNPVDDVDEQKIPNSLARFISLREATKAGKLKYKQNAGIEDLPRWKPTDKIAPRHVKRLPAFKQLPEETNAAFMRRVDRQTKEGLKEAAFETKYKVDVIRNPVSGVVSLNKRPKDMIDEKMKEARRKGGKHKKRNSIEPVEKVERLSSLEKLKLKKYKKLQSKMADNREHDVFERRDTVKFGEVCHSPPVISVLPRLATKPTNKPKLGKKDLLLNSLLEPTKQTKSPAKVIDLKSKRKELPLGTRKMLEKERDSFIELYRKMKNNKNPIRN